MEDDMDMEDTPMGPTMDRMTDTAATAAAMDPMAAATEDTGDMVAMAGTAMAAVVGMDTTEQETI